MVKKTSQQLADQFIDEAIELRKFINSEIESVKNSPIYHLQRSVLNRKEDIDELSSSVTTQSQKRTIASHVTTKEPSNASSHCRKNALSDIIFKAQQQAMQEGSDCWNSAKIYLQLESWADSGLDQYLPLLAVTDSGIKYRNGGQDRYLTQTLLADRLYRLKKSSSKSR